MAETLVALLLVTSSAKECNLVYRWPPSPKSSLRLIRSKPDESTFDGSHLDNPWRASQFSDTNAEAILSGRLQGSISDSDGEYVWSRPHVMRERSMSFSASRNHSPSARTSPPKGSRTDKDKSKVSFEEYNHLFCYTSEVLASLLCPQSSMCHQKFELVVDSLAFVGHPVCAEGDGVWRFKPEKVKFVPRGRESRSGQSSHRASASPDDRSAADKIAPKSTWLKSFHFVLVLDRPDPSSSASGNVSKYFEIIYEQIAFTVTAVLFQEQVLSNFVERECDILGSLRESCRSKGEPYDNYARQALEHSSIAPALKTLYEAIKSSQMAYMTIHNLPLEIQLPPYLDMLLHSGAENESDFFTRPDEEDAQNWGHDMSIGWKLPPLQPWKSLLLLDGHSGLDPSMNLKGSHVNPDDRTLVEGLIRFLETASVTLSLADMASLLDWDLESQVLPTVRWLVQHRRAKVVDLVHAGLKTIFMLPPNFEAPLIQLTSEFETQFSHPSVPSLPEILSAISASVSRQTDNTFFASVVKSKELLPMYHDVVLWMLKRDMLITLHLRIRVVATTKLKIRVRVAREKALAKKAGGFKVQERFRSDPLQELDASGGDSDDPELSPISGTPYLSLSPRAARRHSRRGSNESPRLENDDYVENSGYAKTSDDSDDSDDELEQSGWDTAEDHLQPSMVRDPARATPLQRRWLAAMSDGKDPEIAKRFQLINQYFDGKKTDDEILYRARIGRKQLREVLHHYEEYLQTFLHPS